VTRGRIMGDTLSDSLQGGFLCIYLMLVTGRRLIFLYPNANKYLQIIVALQVPSPRPLGGLLFRSEHENPDHSYKNLGRQLVLWIE
jgi:hypothetical protein